MGSKVKVTDNIFKKALLQRSVNQSNCTKIYMYWLGYRLQFTDTSVETIGYSLILFN